MDLTFSVPKSVSLAWGINGDERIVDALKSAVRETMERDIEPLMMRRVRDNGRAGTRDRTQTRKLIYADFLHKTSRPVEGKPDPHLHIHAFVINWTEQNGKHYAGEFEEIVRQRPSLQAKFEARLARTLERDLGYQVTRTQYTQSGRIKAGWEIRGISRETIETVSRRTEQVEEHAQLHGIHNAAEKGKLGKKTREKKDAGASIEQLRDEWRSRLTDRERETFGRLDGMVPRSKANEHEVAEQSLKFALDHHLYRQSTVERHQVVGTALEHAVTVTPEQMEQSLDRLGIIQRKRNVEGADRELVTTREVLAAEQELISFARDGRGTRKAIGQKEHQFSRDWLNHQQKQAVKHILTSRDTVMAITGGAGTGKTSLMQEAVDAVWGNGKTVHVFAPSTGAREVLQEKGFQSAQTVEHLLRNETLQNLVKDQVLWIDEAGLLDVRSMNTLFRVAKRQNARVILSGDSRQHASPRRGEALRLLEKEARLNIARVEQIQRQKGRYQEAVKFISKGHEVVQAKTGKTGLLMGFDLLDRLGKIKEVGPEQLPKAAAEQYLQSRDQGKSTLVVAPTHREGREVTGQIREGLRQRGLLQPEEHSVPQLVSLNLTEAEKREASTYGDQENLIVQFHQNVAGGFKRGERWRVAGVFDGRVELTSLHSTDRRLLPADVPDRFEVYRENELKLSVGDKVRFTLGGTAAEGNRRISNGRLDEIREINAQGNLVLQSGMVVPKDYGHLDLGYVITSHASQGKDRQVAIAAMGSQSLPAINAKQFYVTVSRGSEDVAIYVDDKARVRRAIERSGEQLSATELAAVPEKEHEVELGQAREHSRPERQGVRERFVAWFRDRVQEHRDRSAGNEPRERGFGRPIDFSPSPGLSRS